MINKKEKRIIFCTRIDIEFVSILGHSVKEDRILLKDNCV